MEDIDPDRSPVKPVKLARGGAGDLSDPSVRLTCCRQERDIVLGF